MAMPTHKQLAYRASLLKSALDEAAPPMYANQSARARSLAGTALLLALPEPRSLDEASQQIDTLRAGALLQAFGREPWASAVLERCAEAVGRDGARIAVHAPDGSVWAGRQWLAYVRWLLTPVDVAAVGTSTLLQ